MTYPIRWRSLCACAAAGLSTGLVPAVHGGGFALIEHGASGMGNAYAGAAAVAHDGSTIWFNPAGMTELDGREVAAALHVIATDTRWSDRGTSLNRVFGGGAVSGPDTEQAGTTSPVPNLYYRARIDERWSYGLGFGAPYGSSTEYDDDWKGRYTTLESSISVLDLNPSIAYRVSDRVSVGGGVSVQYLQAKLSTAVDTAAACLGSIGTVEPGACIAAGIGTPGDVALDGRGEVSGDSTAFSFNLGALFLPREDTRLGVAYRHGTKHELDGDGDFTTNPTLRALLDAQQGNPVQSLLSDTGASAEVDLPPTLMLSVAHELNERVELLGDVTWTGWSSFRELRIRYDNPVQPDTVSIQDYEDVLRYSAGVNVALNARLTLRGGLAFDEEAIPSAERRTARIPGNDRTWLALGAGYAFGDNLTVDVGYAHLFLPETAIDNPNEETRGGSVVRGEYDSSVDILSAQLSWHFN